MDRSARYGWGWYPLRSPPRLGHFRTPRHERGALTLPPGIPPPAFARAPITTDKISGPRRRARPRSADARRRSGVTSAEGTLAPHAYALMPHHAQGAVVTGADVTP